MTTPTPFTHRTVFIGPLDAHEHWAVMYLTGEVDLDTGTRLEAALGLCVECRPGVILVDLTGVTLMDCAGLGVLYGAHQAAADRGISLVLTGRPAPIVARLLRLTGTFAGLERPRRSRARPRDPQPSRHPGTDLSYGSGPRPPATSRTAPSRWGARRPVGAPGGSTPGRPRARALRWSAATGRGRPMMALLIACAVLVSFVVSGP
ncbi:STAS domain-containing protein [Streptomyces sp. NPDC000594]|uniref:STAS domain-containing protein n=1 Tax=Streptomyces sp. NPDC000594 TaxID=3154261 RepID=UPI0033253036